MDINNKTLLNNGHSNGHVLSSLDSSLPFVVEPMVVSCVNVFELYMASQMEQP